MEFACKPRIALEFPIEVGDDTELAGRRAKDGRNEWMERVRYPEIGVGIEQKQSFIAG